MESFWNGVTVLVWVVLLQSATAAIPTYNTSLTCLRGRGRSRQIDIDCFDKNVGSLVFVTRVIHGLTPNTSGCDATAPRATCCPDPTNPARDCVFSSSVEKLKAVRDECNGLLTCWTTMDSVSVDDGQCPERNGLAYGRNSDFARVEFMCLSVLKMSDVCDNDVTMTGDGVYLETNFFRKNNHHSNKTCSCIIATTCEHELVFNVLELNLAEDADGTCTERIVLMEGGANSTIMAVFNCSYDPLHSSNGGDIGNGAALISRSSIVRFDLDLLSNNTGKVLIHVTATKGAHVEVLCGLSEEQKQFNEAPCLPAPVKDLISPTFNTTREACLQGTGLSNDFEISCQQSGIQGLLYVDRIFHGLTPKDMGCNVIGPKNSCCPGYDSDRDCVFSTEQGLSELRKTCDGSEMCYPTVRKVSVTDQCPPRQGGNVTYGTNSYFAFVEYTCINMGLMNDVCHAGTIVRGSEVYMESNVLHKNTQLSNLQCNCHVTARCGQRVLFHVLDLQLTPASTQQSDGSRSCPEEVVVVDMIIGTVSASLDCNSSQAVPVQRGQGSEPWFQSQSNFVHFQLRLGDQHEGKLLLRVTASDGSPVDVRCGRTTELDMWEEHRCNHTLSTSTTVDAASSRPTPSPTADSRPLPDGGDDDTSIMTGIAVGVGVVAFLVVFIVICLLLIVWRGRKQAHDNIDEEEEDDNAVQYVATASDGDQVAFADIIIAVPAPETTTRNNNDYAFVSALYNRVNSNNSEKHVYETLENQGTEKRGYLPDAGLSGDCQDEGGAVGGMGMMGEEADGGAVNPAYQYDNVINLRLQEKETNSW